VARLVYLGTPELAVVPLRALVEAGHEVALVVSGPDRRRGRGAATSPSPVKAAATELGLPVTDSLDEVRSVEAQLGVVVAYGRIIPLSVLDQLDMINLHFSLLPRWRGAAPVERALLAGDKTTGVCVMAVEEGLDTGGVYRRTEMAIHDEDDLESLRGRLVQEGTRLLVDLLAHGVDHLPDPVAQVGEVVYAKKISAEERHLDWDHDATMLARVAAVGRAWTTFRDRRLMVESGRVLRPEEVKNLEHVLGPGQLEGRLVGTGQGVLALGRVKPEGKGFMDSADWARGVRLRPGERLGASRT
jgi:methionyl-tRNA formyltransferase